MNEELLSIGETAQILHVSIDTLRRWDKNGALPSFRPNAKGHRFYRKQDIYNFLSKGDPASLARYWVMGKTPIPLPSAFYCQTSDVFHARIQRLEIELEKITKLKSIHSLVTAVAGEIGNNSFNHNIGNWPDEPGVFLSHEPSLKQVVLADRGVGILATLRRVLPDLKNDYEAMQVAFTQYITSRAPEVRGNGLKFVRDVITENNLRLLFQSGDTELRLKQGDDKLNFKNVSIPFHGCIAILNY